MTMGAQIVRTQQFHLAHHGEDAPGAQLAIGCGLTAGADSFPLLWTRRITGQELTQGRSAGLMHGRPDGCLQGFQIQLVTLETAIRSAMHQAGAAALSQRSEEHTSELQSPDHLVCRLLLEKKKN